MNRYTRNNFAKSLSYHSSLHNSKYYVNNLLYYQPNVSFASSMGQKKKIKILSEPKLLEIKDLTKMIAKEKNRLYLFENLSFDIHATMKIGLLGHNGAGKTSLMKILSDKDSDYQGQIIAHQENVPWSTSNNKTTNNLRIGYLEQEPSLNKNLTIFEAVMEGLEYITSLQKRYDHIISEMCDPLCDITTLMTEHDSIVNRLDFLNGWNIDSEVINSCRALKCPDDLNRIIGTLSGGELRRVALAKLLLSRPDVLLLDEPTNHLDITSVEWLEKHILSFRGIVITVTHDRVFLETTCNTVMELDHGRLYMHYGSYTEWLKKRSSITFTTDNIQDKLKKTIDREYDMLKKGQKLKARSNKIKELEKQLDEHDGIIPFVGYEPSLLVPQGPMLKGKFILNVQDLTYINSEIDRCFFKNLTFSLSPGMVVGIVGPNGIGKTTLFKLLVGQLTPTSGSILINNSVQIGYIDQTRNTLNPLNMVYEEILDGHDPSSSIIINESKEIQGRQYVRQFNFDGKTQEKLVGFLSGGERNRVNLAKSLKNGCNVLLLDEPSNDLDVDTVRKLEECMETFRGIVCVISHDRFFLDRVCTHLIAFESILNNNNNGNDASYETKVQWFEGNYSEYLAFKYAKKQNKKKKINKEGENNANDDDDDDNNDDDDDDDAPIDINKITQKNVKTVEYWSPNVGKNAADIRHEKQKRYSSNKRSKVRIR